jgi:hypothetical protein
MADPSKPNSNPHGEEIREPTDAEVEATIVGQHREMYDDRLGPTSRRKTIFDFYKNRLIQANKEKQEKFQRELERTGEARDRLREAREKNKDDPDMLAELPPDNAPTEQLLAWYDKSFEPAPHVPFPSEGTRVYGHGSGAPSVQHWPPFANPTEKQLRKERMERDIYIHGHPDPKDIAAEEAEEMRYRLQLAAEREKARKQVESEFAPQHPVVPYVSEDERLGKVLAEGLSKQKPITKRRPQRSQIKIWSEVKKHKGWYLVAFILGGLPVGIATIWPTLTDKKVPQWLAENGLPRLTTLVIAWVAIAAIIALVIVARSCQTAMRNTESRSEGDESR